MTYARFVFIVTILGALFLALIISPLVNILFGADYSEATGALRWLLPGIVLGGVARVLANDLAARGRPELNMYTALLVVIVNVLANIILIPGMGIKGAAIATTLAYSINFVVKLALYARLSGNCWWKPILFTCKDLDMVRSRVGGIRKSA